MARGSVEKGSMIPPNLAERAGSVQMLETVEGHTFDLSSNRSLEHLDNSKT